MTRIMTSFQRLHWLQLVVHAGALALLIWLLFDYFSGRMSVNPIQELTQRSGRYALYLLVLSLAATPANSLFGFRPALKVRRALGLYAFMFAAIHFLTFLGLDYGFDWSLIPGAIVEKRFVLVGLAAFTILLGLALTSTKGSMKRLGKRWKRLHQGVYLAGLLVILHYAWASKGDLFRLQGNIWQPLIFGVIVVLLLLVRLPAVRSRLARTLQVARRGKESGGTGEKSAKLKPDL